MKWPVAVVNQPSEGRSETTRECRTVTLLDFCCLMLRSALSSSTAKQSKPFRCCTRVSAARATSSVRSPKQWSGLWPGVRSKCLRRTVKGILEKKSSRCQDCRPELERYLLQVDKQTKGYFPTPEAVHSAGLKIKKRAFQSFNFMMTTSKTRAHWSSCLRGRLEKQLGGAPVTPRSEVGAAHGRDRLRAP